MKFVHIADLHLDSVYVNLSDKTNLGEQRRIEQKKILRKMVDYIKENNIELLFIAGDLYEHKYIRKSTIEYLNNLFCEIPDTRIYISPGNHDPYLVDSYYNTFNWSENVKIFTGKYERIQLEDIDIYGYGFEDFYCMNSSIEMLEIVNKEKVNIFVTHADITGGYVGENLYNPIPLKVLQNKEFDYVALGHIHKGNDYGNICYSGSMLAHGFDELGTHGMLVGEIIDKEVYIEKIVLDEKEFKEIKIDMSEISYFEDLILKINQIHIEKNQYIKIILQGNRNFKIDIYKILKLIESERIIKIKDETKLTIDLLKLAKEPTLKGIFVKKMLNKLTDDVEKNMKIQKAIEIGLEVLE